MAIDPATYTQAYVDNADYDEAESLTKAKAFRTACRRILVLFESQRQAGVEHQLRKDEYRKQLEAVDRWIAARSTTGGGGGQVIYASMEDFRQ